MFKGFKKALEGLDAALANASVPVYDNGVGQQRIGRVYSCESLSFRPTQLIAEGGYSFVYAAEDVNNPQIRYAVKFILVSEDEAVANAKAEIELLRNLPAHQNIMKFYSGNIRDGEAVVVTEIIDGGSLADKLLSRRGSPFRQDEILRMMMDVTLAITHLHAQEPPIAHRDIKLENVLYDPMQRRFKLCDFGSCTTRACRYESFKDIAREAEIIAAHSTLMYRAPEMVDLYQKKLVCEKVDVWALGCLFYTLLYTKHPFQDGSSLQILNATYEIPEAPVYPPSFMQLMKCMLNPEPESRPDIFIILEGFSRLLNIQMDPKLKQLGDARRQTQMSKRPSGRPPAAPLAQRASPNQSAGGMTAVKPSATPTSLQSPASSPQPLRSAMSASPFARSVPPQVAAPVPRRVEQEQQSADEDEDWADFESAGGASNASLFSNPSTSRSASPSNKIDSDLLDQLYDGMNLKGTRSSPLANTEATKTARASTDPFVDLFGFGKN